MNIALFEDDGWKNLLPLTWLRCPAELMLGRCRLLDLIAKSFGRPIVRMLGRSYLEQTMNARCGLSSVDPNQDWCLVNARLVCHETVSPPPIGVGWLDDGELVAISVSRNQLDLFSAETLLDATARTERLAEFAIDTAPAGLRLIEFPWEPALLNGPALARQLQPDGRHLGRIDPGVHLVNPAAIQIGTGVRIKPGVVLDAEDGPIQIDNDVLIEPNAVVQGPCFIGAQSIVRPGAVIRANTSIGPMSRIGGELEGSILHGFANKQHDGFLGHSYVCPWVNLGADTVTSDLKNTYGTIRVALNGVEVESGERFIGSIIGDHAKTGIGTILPTGCILGVAANVFTPGAVPKFVPSFSWLTERGPESARIDKVVEIARTVTARRRVEFSATDERDLRAAAAAAGQIESWPG